ncbi:MAG TPA: hypothetical protein VMF13_08840 [Luteitalea sp.]|nr:hypothetical protein [Luteitalea sp.]
MHAPMTFDPRTPQGLPGADPTQLTLFGPPRRRFRAPGRLATALLSAAGAFALVYAARTIMQGSPGISGDVLDDERFDELSPAHAGYDA